MLNWFLTIFPMLTIFVFGSSCLPQLESVAKISNLQYIDMLQCIGDTIRWSTSIYWAFQYIECFNILKYFNILKHYVLICFNIFKCFNILKHINTLQYNILEWSIYRSISIHCKLLIFATDSSCSPLSFFSRRTTDQRTG